MLPGGVQRHVGDLANGLANRNCDVTVASGAGYFANRLDERVTFLELPLTAPPGGRKSVIDFARALMRLRTYLKVRKCDLIHSHQRYSSVLGHALSTANRIPHVVTCHSLFDSGRLYSVFGSHTIAVSNVVKKMLIERFRRPPASISVLYNEIGPSPTVSARKKNDWLKGVGVRHSAAIIACIGRFVPEKDLATTIRALRLLRERNSLDSVQCLFVGYGVQAGQLEAEAKISGLNDVIKFLPSSTDPQLVFSVVKFGILSSLQEAGIPYSILEAAAHGKPYVATDIGAIPEFITHRQNGLLVPPRRPDHLAEAVQLLLRDRTLVRKLGENAKRRYQRYHRSNGFAEKTIEVYKKASRG
jgi:glycosyltransferase involved in cell wall biosynthesis